MNPIAGSNPHGLETRPIALHVFQNDRYLLSTESDTGLYCYPTFPEWLRLGFGEDWTWHPGEDGENGARTYSFREWQELQPKYHTRTGDLEKDRDSLIIVERGNHFSAQSEAIGGYFLEVPVLDFTPAMCQKEMGEKVGQHLTWVMQRYLNDSYVRDGETRTRINSTQSHWYSTWFGENPDEARNDPFSQYDLREYILPYIESEIPDLPRTTTQRQVTAIVKSLNERLKDRTD